MDAAATETLDAFVGQGWTDHADDAAGVWKRLPRGIDLAKDKTHLALLAGLAVHVAGEHLGRFDDGIALLGRLEKHPAFDAATPEGKAVVRGKAVLHLCAGRGAEARRFEEASRAGAGLPPASDRIRILATASTAMANLGRIVDARAALEEALNLAAYGPGAKDPAARSLAVTGNNLAVILENAKTRTPEQNSLMVRAAEVGLRFWSVAGGPSETALAHYRLSRSLALAGQAARSGEQAQKCLDVAAANGSDGFQMFGGHEAMAWARLAGGDAPAAKAARDAAARTAVAIDDAETKAMCDADLAALDKALAGTKA